MKDLLWEIPVKEKRGIGEGEPSDCDPPQNPMKQRGRKEDLERKVSDCCTVTRKFCLTHGESLRQSLLFEKSCLVKTSLP